MQKAAAMSFRPFSTQIPRIVLVFCPVVAGSTLKAQALLAALSRLFPSNHEELSSSYLHCSTLLVDVGGGRRNLFERIRLQKPDLTSRTVLQDLPKVIKGRESTNGVEYMSNDFVYSSAL